VHFLVIVIFCVLYTLTWAKTSYGSVHVCLSVCRVFRGSTQPAWPGVIVPTGVLNLHDLGWQKCKYDRRVTNDLGSHQCNNDLRDVAWRTPLCFDFVVPVGRGDPANGVCVSWCYLPCYIIGVLVSSATVFVCRCMLLYVINKLVDKIQPQFCN
jgi:hypothetical protein